MNASLADSNVLLDVATLDPQWQRWSEQQLLAAAPGGVFINPIIYAELAPAFPSEAALNAWLAGSAIRFLPLPYAAGWRAAQAFRRYRRGGGAKTSPLPDFYIGAQAEVEQLAVITRDSARYRTYFPSVRLIVP